MASVASIMPRKMTTTIEGATTYKRGHADCCCEEGNIAVAMMTAKQKTLTYTMASAIVFV